MHKVSADLCLPFQVSCVSFRKQLSQLTNVLKLWMKFGRNSSLKKFHSVNKALRNACKISLKKLNPGKHFVLFTDASFTSAGYALTIADNRDPNLFRKILTKYLEIPEFALILWETTNSTIVLMGNEISQAILQDRSISTSAVDCM